MRGINIGIPIGSGGINPLFRNLLRNGNFEKGNVMTSIASPATNTTGLYYDTANITPAMQSSGGSQSNNWGKFTFLASGFGWIGMGEPATGKPFQVIGGQSLVLSGYIQTNTIAVGRPITFGVRFYDSTGAPVSNITIATISGTTAWTFYQDLIKIPANATQCDIMFYNDYDPTADRTLNSWFGVDKLQIMMGNLAINGDMELVPSPNTAPTTTTTRIIDGTAGGSIPPTNNKFNWYQSGSNGFEAQYDTSIFYQGTASMRVSTKVANSYNQLYIVNPFGGTTSNYSYGIPAMPNKAYAYSFRMKTNYVSGDSANGAYVNIACGKADGTYANWQITTTAVKVTQDWTLYSGVIYTTPNTVSIQIDPRVYGHTGVATLIMDAWFDNIALIPIDQEVTGSNLFSTSDFEGGLGLWAPYVNGGTGTNPKVTIDPVNGRNGGACAKIESLGTYTYFGTLHTLPSLLTIGKLYKLSGWVKGDPGTTIIAFPGASNLGQSPMSVACDGTWKYIAVYFIATAVSHTQYFRSGTAGSITFYVDDVEIKEVI